MTDALYQENEKVLVHHQNNIYEAKVLKHELKVDPKNKQDTTKKHFYFIHYLGWKEKWNEWVPQDRILKYSDENVELMNSIRGKTRSSSGLAPQNPSGNTQSVQSNIQPLTKKKIKPVNHDEGTASSNKRKREKEGYTQHDKVIDINIPDPLKKILVDDWGFITNDKSLVTLPRSPTVKTLLEEFVKLNKNIENINQVADGISSYFNKALGCILLYKFERPQYSDILKSNPNKPMSEIYGAEHLLRLFVKMPELISLSGMEDQTIQTITTTFQELIKYLEQNMSTLFLKEYSPVTAYYNRLASN